MRVSKLSILNFRSVASAELYFSGHTLIVGGNNVGKSTVCEALDLTLGADRLNRPSPVDEFDFHNAQYIEADGQTIRPIRIEVVLTDLTEDIKRLCGGEALEFWKDGEQRVLDEGEIGLVDDPGVQPCLRLVTIAQYDEEEDEFVARTIFAHGEGPEETRKAISAKIKRAIGFLYLRTHRTGSRALSLERGSLLDNILRLKGLRAGLWEKVRDRLGKLDPPIEDCATELRPVLDQIESRLGQYISAEAPEQGTRLHVSQLTREHLRKTLSFFLTTQEGQCAVPFQEAGTGTINTLMLALLSFLAEIKTDNVIFAMEEPEIALPPHTQRRIANYLLTKTSQCFVTSHSPYVIECFEPQSILRLARDKASVLTGIPVNLPASMKTKTYRSQLRRAIAEAMLGRGVIVGEGQTEQYALFAVAQKLEDADANLFPLDLAGITVVNSEGDGNLETMGHFFKELDIPAFAFYDRKQRTTEDIQKIQAAFTASTEIPFKGAETMLASEVNTDRQWDFLEVLRSEDTDSRLGIPPTRPIDEKLRELTVAILKRLKGERGAARLIELCSVGELPQTPVAFLHDIYERFPRPKVKEVAVDDSGAAATDSAAKSAEIDTEN